MMTAPAAVEAEGAIVPSCGLLAEANGCHASRGGRNDSCQKSKHDQVF